MDFAGDAAGQIGQQIKPGAAESSSVTPRPSGEWRCWNANM